MVLENKHKNEKSSKVFVKCRPQAVSEASVVVIFVYFTKKAIFTNKQLPRKVIFPYFLSYKALLPVSGEVRKSNHKAAGKRGPEVVKASPVPAPNTLATPKGTPPTQPPNSIFIYKIKVIYKIYR